MRLHSSLPGYGITTIAFYALAASAHSTEPLFQTADHHPFTQIYGRPEFFAGSVLARGTSRVGLIAEITSHFDPAGTGIEQLELDGETYRIAFGVRHAPRDRLELEASMPVVRHSGGFLDGLVESWHELIGVSNNGRESRPRNELDFRYTVDGSDEFDLDESSTGLGDIQLGARYQLLDTAPGTRKLAAHVSVELPTGDAESLHGNGATDYSVGLGFSDPRTLAALNMTLSAHAGVLFVGDGDVLSEIAERTVPFGGVQLGWLIGRRFDLLVQVQAAGHYYDSRLSTLGDSTVEFSVGGNVRFPESGWNWTFGIVEDGLSDMMSDFALHTTLSRTLRGGK